MTYYKAVVDQNLTYQRLEAEGKHTKRITVRMIKMIIILNAVIRDGQEWKIVGVIRQHAS